MTHPHPKRRVIPQAVLTRSSKLKTVGPAVNVVRPVNIADSKLTVNRPRLMSNDFKRGHSQVTRPFNKYSTNKNIIFNKNVNTIMLKDTTARERAVVSVNKGKEVNVVKASTCLVWKAKHSSTSTTFKKYSYIDARGRSKSIMAWISKRANFSYYIQGNPQQKEYKEKGVIDSGCSRHMTGNKCYLTEYKDYNGGFVSFRDGKGRISRKGKIKTGKLDFDDVYFCKELKYNLFSVSQMCDKKNNVLFTNTECLVLSSDFKLLDESQVLLRVPRKDNIYSVDLKSVVPTGGLTCLFAKATIDESNLWHKGLGHINYKTRNKLVRETLALVIKPHNKTPYELIRERPPLIGFMKPFGCLVTILNTRDHLGKFDGKADEGFFVGYSMVSKAMRVFNRRTRIVEETLNIRFLENAPNVKGNGPDYLFDGDSLTISMNYVPVVAGNQTNGIAGTKDNIVVGPKDSAVDVAKNATEVDESGASNKGKKDKQATISDAAGPSFADAAPLSPVNVIGTPVSNTNAFEENLVE
ncbi:ribonuclease H-like domain-containing protein [Tanacetum coccineum]